MKSIIIEENEIFDAHFHIVPQAFFLCGLCSPQNFDYLNFQYEAFLKNCQEQNLEKFKENLAKIIFNELNSFVPKNKKFRGISCAQNKTEYFLQNEISKRVLALSKNRFSIFTAFAIHPQNPSEKNLDFLLSALRNHEIDAIGEAGLDFYKENKKNADLQKKVFDLQVRAALNFQKPLILHMRKSLDCIFLDSKLQEYLRALPFVIFHSFSGTSNFANAILKRGINAYFSFGERAIFGAKNVLDCKKNLAKNRILMETDSPFCKEKSTFSTLKNILKIKI